MHEHIHSWDYFREGVEMMSNTTDKLKIVFRAEMALIKAEAKRTQTNFILIALAMSCGILAIVAFNIGLYFHFTGVSEARNAAMAIVAINLAIAMIPIFLASRIKPNNEEALLIEIRDKAAESLVKPVENLFSPSSSLNTLSSLSSFSPLLGIVLKSFSKSKK